MYSLIGVVLVAAGVGAYFAIAGGTDYSEAWQQHLEELAANSNNLTQGGGHKYALIINVSYKDTQLRIDARLLKVRHQKALVFLAPSLMARICVSILKLEVSMSRGCEMMCGVKAVMRTNQVAASANLTHALRMVSALTRMLGTSGMLYAVWPRNQDLMMSSGFTIPGTVLSRRIVLVLRKTVWMKSSCLPTMTKTVTMSVTIGSRGRISGVPLTKRRRRLPFRLLSLWYHVRSPMDDACYW